MFNTLELNADLTRIRQQELLAAAEKLHREQLPRESKRPVLAALGKRLVNLGERLQQSAQMPEPVYTLNTEQA